MGSRGWEVFSAFGLLNLFCVFLKHEGTNAQSHEVFFEKKALKHEGTKVRMHEVFFEKKALKHEDTKAQRHEVFYKTKLLMNGKYFQLPPWGIEGAFFVSRKARKGVKTQRSKDAKDFF
jgi:hypothetical protein